MSDMDRTATMIPKRSQLQAVKVHQVMLLIGVIRMKFNLFNLLFED